MRPMHSMLACLSLSLAVSSGVASPARATLFTWVASLSGDQELPPNASTGTGSGTVTFDDATNLLTVNLDWSGLTGEGIQAHIHCCVASPPGNVGIALNLWLSSDSPRPATGDYAASFDLDDVAPFRAAFVTANGGTTLSAWAALQAAMDANEGRAYFNIHTALFPGGEIRGNLAPIPEPTAALVFAAGLAVVSSMGRTRRA